jgi:hypothetical protein
MFRQVIVVSVTLSIGTISAAAQMWEENACLGHVWIHRYVATITSKSDSESDPLSCVFDPSSRIGEQVLRVCNDWGGDSKHGCYVKGTFRAMGKQRELTSVLDVQKTEGECGNVVCE